MAYLGYIFTGVSYHIYHQRPSTSSKKALCKGYIERSKQRNTPLPSKYFPLATSDVTSRLQYSPRSLSVIGSQTPVKQEIAEGTFAMWCGVGGENMEKTDGGIFRYNPSIHT